MAEPALDRAAAPLPHLTTIQHAFGPHDLSDVRVEIGGAAGEASRRIGARAFTSGERIAFRESPSLRLAAHEAAHVVQQRAGVQLPDGVGQRGDAYERNADAVADAVVSGGSARALLGVPDTGNNSAGVQLACTCGGSCKRCSSAVQLQDAPLTAEADDVAAEHQKLIEAKLEEVEEIETGTGKYLHLDAAQMKSERARAMRELAVLLAGDPQTYEALTELEDKAEQAGKSETAAVATLVVPGSKPGLDLTWSNDLSWGFPETWADRLQKALRPLFDVDEERRRREKAWDRLTASGDDIPAYLVRHGLPVSFDQAYELDHFTMSPIYAKLPSANPLSGFALAMGEYQGAYAREQLAMRYAAAIQGFIASVRSGEARVDAVVFPQFAHDRQWQPTPSDLFRDAPVNPFAEDRINPYEWERKTYQILMAIGLVDVFTANEHGRKEFARVLARADALLASRSSAERLVLAHLWASEHGYYAFVRDAIWKAIKRDFPTIAKDALVDTGTFVLIQWIPVVNLLYDAYLVGKGIYNAVDAAWTLAEAEDAAASAKTIVNLQRATARLALAEHTEALKMVTAALEAFGGWAAMRGAMEKTASATAGAAGKAGKQAAGATAKTVDRLVAGTAKEVSIAGERHVLTIIEQFGRMFIRMCSPSCGEIVHKLRRLLVHLDEMGADTFAQDPVARLLEKAMKLENRLAKLSQKEGEEQLAKLVQAVEELGGKHPNIAKALPEIESATAGQPTLYPNLEPRRLGAELAEAAKLGVKPLRAGDSGFDAAFDAMVNQGTIKFVITKDGNLVVMPKVVGGKELSHPVLSEGRAVLAAGEAEISSAAGTRFGTDIRMHSGHFKPEQSTEALAREAFKKIGVTFP